MTQPRPAAVHRSEADQVTADPRVGQAARRRARGRFVLTQPPPPRPEPARPTRDGEDPTPPGSVGTATDAEHHDELIDTIDELIADPVSAER
jgi:hypothetical protein